MRFVIPFSRRGTFVVLFSICLKGIIMTATPLTLDLTYQVLQASSGAAWSPNPYVSFLQLTIKMWLLLPVDHPSLPSAWSLGTFQPSIGLYLLVFMVKSPLLLIDILTGFLIYTVIRGEGLASNAAQLGFYAWILNPYVLFVNEMWAAVDLLPTFLLLVSLACLRGGRILQGSLAYAIAVAVKLYPIVLLPLFPFVIKPRKASGPILVSGLVGVALYSAWLWHAGYNAWSQLTQFGPFTQYFSEFTVAAWGGQMVGLATHGAYGRVRFHCRKVVEAG